MPSDDWRSRSGPLWEVRDRLADMLGQSRPRGVRIALYLEPGDSPNFSAWFSPAEAMDLLHALRYDRAYRATRERSSNAE